jgi:hypothetical protein
LPRGAAERPGGVLVVAGVELLEALLTGVLREGQHVGRTGGAAETSDEQKTTDRE